MQAGGGVLGDMASAMGFLEPAVCHVGLAVCGSARRQKGIDFSEGRGQELRLSLLSSLFFSLRSASCTIILLWHFYATRVVLPLSLPSRQRNVLPTLCFILFLSFRVMALSSLPSFRRLKVSSSTRGMSLKRINVRSKGEKISTPL